MVCRHMHAIMSMAFNMGYGDVRKYNPWVSYTCDNIHIASETYGTIICLSPQGGEYDTNKTGGGATTPFPSNGYAPVAVLPPVNATLAAGTTENCGIWHEAAAGESCVVICMQGMITHDLSVEVNPSLDTQDCTGSLQIGLTYCVGPTQSWDVPFIDEDDV
ncbi:hypothetical protein BJX99DRAFT_227652 [Aspergillus californicus]